MFPLLAILFAFAAFATLAVWAEQPGEDGLVDLLLGLLGSLTIAGVALPSFVCVLLLRRMRIEPIGVPLTDLLARLAGHGGATAIEATHMQRINRPRGIAFAAAGAILLLGVIVAPMPADTQTATNVMRLVDQATLLAFFLLVRARRYFQVSADSLLAADKRPPILFLRSFDDDAKQQYGDSRRALLDFSLETRLANHFLHFGPFIAIGSPKESVPQIGAARVLLADDQWQSQVLDWMKHAQLIIMYSGKTQWVNWELRKVVDSGRATSLVLMFPEIKAWRRSKRNEDIAARVEHIRSVFRDTPWNEELMAYGDFAGLRAMLFRADGSMVMVKSRSRSRDAYHLAALVAHQQLLDAAPVTLAAELAA